MTQIGLFEAGGCKVVDVGMSYAGATPAPILRWRCCKCQNENSPMRLVCPGCKHQRCDNPKGHVPKDSKRKKS